MKKCCGNCADSKRKWGTTVYCKFFGMPVSASYSGCHRHRPKIVEVENVTTDSERVLGDVRGPEEGTEVQERTG